LCHAPVNFFLQIKKLFTTNNNFTDQKVDDDLGKKRKVDEIINSTQNDIERLEESILQLQENLTKQMGNSLYFLLQDVK